MEEAASTSERQHQQQQNGTTSTSTSNGDAKKEEKAVSFGKLFAFADSLDKLLMIIGTIGAFGNGISMPLMTILFGDLVDSFGQNQANQDVVAVVSKVHIHFHINSTILIHSLFS